MRTSNVFSIIKATKEKLKRNNEQCKKAACLNAEADYKRIKDEEREKRTKKIEYLEAKQTNLLSNIRNIKNPVVISFSADEQIAGKKYKELKNKVDATRLELLNIRHSVLKPWQIFLTKVCTTVFFIFILSRLAGENKELIESLTFIDVFQNLLQYSKISLFLDFLLQDLFIVASISYAIAMTMKNSTTFLRPETKTTLFWALGFSAIGLFISSMLFSY
jgi:hypothetical protein